MAFSGKRNHDTIVLTSSIDLSGAQFRFVFQSGSLAVIGGTRKNVLGILQNKPTSNQDAIIDISPGLHKVVFGASVNNAAFIASDASGRAVLITPLEGAVASGNTGAFSAGLAIRKITAAGERGEIMFRPDYVVI